MRRLLAVAATVVVMVLAGPARAGEVPVAVTGAVSGTLGSTTPIIFPPGARPTVKADGSCECQNGGKTWACRRAVDYMTAIMCNANGSLRLVCPDDPKELCSFFNEPTCATPREIPVCHMKDEPQ